LLTRLLLTVITLLFACSLAGAEMYQWVDEKGVVIAKTASSGRFDGVIEMFVTDWCGYCKKAKKYMDSKGIRYVAYDIEKDSAAKSRFEGLGGRGVPLILIGSHRMSGFSPEALENYINKQ
jgi:glutaredoxin-like YruB-family protein